MVIFKKAEFYKKNSAFYFVFCKIVTTFVNINQIKIKDMERILNIIDGRFGKRVLKPQYRVWWRTITYGSLFFLFFRFVVIPFFEFWEKVIMFLNFVIWG